MLKDDIFVNEEQQQAIEHNRGPLLIIAGAGTGKTTVITEKIKYLISKKLAKSEEILALTFTEKASLEMEERVDKAMPYGYIDMQIATFHAFADQILREEIVEIGMNPGYKLLTQAESVIYLRNNLFLFDLKYFQPLGNPNKFIEALLQHFSRLRDEDIDPDTYLVFAKAQEKNNEILQEEKEKLLELAQAFQKFQNLKTKEGYFDFEDLIFYLLKLFRTRQNLLKNYQRRFRYVLVDEFQDTNIAQYALLKLLCPSQNNPNLTVVGDDSQAIYKFRGASISNIMAFMHDYNLAKQISLIKNYRSNQSILDAAYRLIKNNNPDTLEAKLGISKKLLAVTKKDKNNQEVIKFNFFQKVDQEADFIAYKILKLIKKYQYSDIAILIRANNHANPIIRALIQRGIPYQFLGPGILFKQPEIKDLIAYLKVLYNFEDSASLFRVLSMDIFELDQKDLQTLLIFARKTNRSVFQTLEIYLSFIAKDLYKDQYAIFKNYLPLLREETKSKLLNFYKMMIRHISLIKKDTTGQILYYFLEDTKYLNKLVSFKTEEEEKIASNITKFFEKLKAFEAEHEDASINAVVDYLNMCLELGESPKAEEVDRDIVNAVNILTIHAAKGLEFPVVFLVNLSKGRFPTIARKETIPIAEALIKEILPQGDYHLQEERRLFYVGITRAKDKIYLSSSNYYGEGKRERKLSPFISETLGESTVEKYLKNKHEEKRQLTIFDFKNQNETAVSTISNNIQKLPKMTNFSFSQLETYGICPLKYKYQYVMKVPTLPQAATSFGESIHTTLQYFYHEYLKNNKVDLKRLIAIYERNFIPFGFSSFNHQERMKKKGREILDLFYNQFHSTDLKIIDLEKFFKIKIADDIFILGKIDRVDLVNKDEIEIIDYKTGKKPEKKELENNLQLAIYALAAIDRGLYNKDINRVILSFYYLQENVKISMKKSQTEMEALKDGITKVVQTIRENDFVPNVGIWCSFCPYKIVCDAWH